MKLTNKNDKTLTLLTKSLVAFNALKKNVESIRSIIYWGLIELCYDYNFQYLTPKEAFELGLLKKEFNNPSW